MRSNVPPSAGGRGAIRIVVAIEQSLYHRGLAALLATEQEFEIVGEAASPRETVALCRQLKPTVLVMDAVMPDLDGVPAIVAVRSVSPRTGILAVADRGEGHCPVLQLHEREHDPAGGRPCDPPTDCLQLAVARGALGAIRASAEPSDLFRAVRTVASGTAWYEAGTASRLLARALATAGGSGADGLSARDLEVASLVAEGRCNKEIARALDIGEPSVKRHVGRILHRLGLAGRVQLALYLVRHPQVLEPHAPTR